MKTKIEGKEILNLIEEIHPIIAEAPKEVAEMALISEALAIRNPHMTHEQFRNCLQQAYETLMMIADTAGAKIQ